MYCAFCMPLLFSMPCLFICTSEYRIVYAMSFPSAWKWFWKCQSRLLYNVITCLLFDFIVSSACGRLLREAKHLSGAQLKKRMGIFLFFFSLFAVCNLSKVSDCRIYSLCAELLLKLWHCVKETYMMSCHTCVYGEGVTSQKFIVSSTQKRLNYTVYWLQ